MKTQFNRSGWFYRRLKQFLADFSLVLEVLFPSRPVVVL